MVPPRPARSSLMKHWYAVEVRQVIMLLFVVITTIYLGYSNVSTFCTKFENAYSHNVTSYVIIGGVVAGAAWYTYRLSMGSSGTSFLQPTL
jgi:uncharacterized membrane protein